MPGPPLTGALGGLPGLIPPPLCSPLLGGAAPESLSAVCVDPGLTACPFAPYQVGHSRAREIQVHCIHLLPWSTRWDARGGPVWGWASKNSMEMGWGQGGVLSSPLRFWVGDAPQITATGSPRSS